MALPMRRVVERGKRKNATFYATNPTTSFEMHGACSHGSSRDRGTSSLQTTPFGRLKEETGGGRCELGV
jgi:hypothetical protein